MKAPSKLFVVGLGAEGVEVLHPVAHPAQITQDQLVEILTLEKELDLIRRRIVVKRLKIAAAMLAGATIEAGRHEATINPKRKGMACVEISPFTGGILNPHAREEHRELVATFDKCLLKPIFAT